MSVVAVCMWASVLKELNMQLGRQKHNSVVGGKGGTWRGAHCVIQSLGTKMSQRGQSLSYVIVIKEGFM